jgi:serine/threonine protein kinase
MLSENDLAGKDLDGYHMAAELESSASSRIFLGESISPLASSKRVIVKLLHEVDENTQQKRGNIPQAITAVQQLQHPHILPILSAGIYNDIPYLITDYAAAGSLEDRLQRRPSGQPMQLEEALSVLAQIGHALQYAHEKQIIHGRLKPQNVLFDIDGKVLVADFYTHYFALPDKSDPSNPAGASIYLAPEQLAGHSSEKSDQYALGCLAYEMLTGSKAFMIPSINAPGTYYRTRSLIGPARINPALPSYIEKAILKAMSKDPDQRYPNVAEFLTALGILPPDSSHQQEEVEKVLALIETTVPRLPATPIPAPVTFEGEKTRNVTSPEEYDSIALSDSVPPLSIARARLLEPRTKVSAMASLPYAISRNLPFKTTWGNLTPMQRRVLAVLLCLVVIVLVMGVLFIPSKLPTSATPPAYTTIPAHGPTQIVSSATAIPAKSTYVSIPGINVSAQNTAIAQGTSQPPSKKPTQGTGSSSHGSGSSHNSGSSQGSNSGSTTKSATPTVAPAPTPTAAPIPTPTTAPTPTPTPIPTPTSTLTQVALSAFFNNKAMGGAPGAANFDGSGYSYPASQLPSGGSITVNGVPYQFPSSSSGSDNVIAAGQTIGLTAGHYRQANLLVSASWGPVSGTVTIQYSDGSTSSANVSVADWITGSASGLRTPYRYAPNTIDQSAAYIYAITIAMDPTRTASAVVLPGQVSGPYQTGRLHVFALTVVP